jgi:hypothetical protein
MGLTNVLNILRYVSTYILLIKQKFRVTPFLHLNPERNDYILKI